MTDKQMPDLDDEVVSRALRHLADSLATPYTDAPMPERSVLERRKSERRRARVLAVTGGTIMLIALGLTLGVSVGGSPTSPMNTTSPVFLPERPVLDVSPTVNLDITWAGRQVSVNLASGSITEASPLVSNASPGAELAIGLARSGYIIGESLGDSGSNGATVSVSDNLQKVLHVWSARDGTYPAPASDPADVWLSNPFNSLGQAQEYNGRAVAIGSPVTIPQGSGVLGQVGADLVLVTPADPIETLELWDPASQRVVMNLGPFDQEATTATELVWTSGNLLHIYSVASSRQVTVPGPSGDWATALTPSPGGDSLAVIWQPAPGSSGASTRAHIEAESDLYVVSANTGTSTIVPGSAEAVGPVAWTSDGSRAFFGQGTHTGHVGISTVAVGHGDAIRLDIPAVTLPGSFGPTEGSLIVWDR